jgi:hypothetical protein
MRRLAAPATPPAGGVIASASATTGNGSATELASRASHTRARSSGSWWSGMAASARPAIGKRSDAPSRVRLLEINPEFENQTTVLAT